MNDNEKLEKYNINTKIIAKTLKEKKGFRSYQT